MLIKSDPMEKSSNMNHVNPENINIIKKIIDDFEHGEATPKPPKRKRSKTKKISNSDSLIHKYKRSQISPKTAGSLDGKPIKFQPSGSVEDFFKNENDVYINFFENCDSENADANAFRKFVHRKSLFKSSNSAKFSEGFGDEFRVLRESEWHQERVKNNVKEVSKIIF
ncbi:hypothetical protein JTB14_007984 [Gonioctena quinquepunctata]|nr:hypothetical protein JTB14_007984 [Gonioctena quinquepunctata]